MKKYFIPFGPEIPITSVTEFSRMRLSEEDLRSAWQVCGPSVEMNLRRRGDGRCLELWQVIACAYLEGLNHGAGLAADR